jgi:hypothetical protein
MPEILCHRHLGGIDRPRGRGLGRVIAGINGNTAASIAVMASPFFEDAPRFNRELAVFAAEAARW